MQLVVQSYNVWRCVYYVMHRTPSPVGMMFMTRSDTQGAQTSQRGEKPSRADRSILCPPFRTSQDHLWAGMTKGALLLRGLWRVSVSCRDGESLSTLSDFAPIKVSAGTGDYAFSLQLK
jgi:hypothetical protein